MPRANSQIMSAAVLKTSVRLFVRPRSFCFSCFVLICLILQGSDNLLTELPTTAYLQSAWRGHCSHRNGQATYSPFRNMYYAESIFVDSVTVGNFEKDRKRLTLLAQCFSTNQRCLFAPLPTPGKKPRHYCACRSALSYFLHTYKNY